MTAHHATPPAVHSATERSLRLHTLWKALDAVPLPRLAAWAEAAWKAHSFGAESWAVFGVRPCLERARLVAPIAAEAWARRGPAYFLDLLPRELALARARVGLAALLPVRQALAALAPYAGVEPAISRIRRVPSNAALLLAVEDLEALLVAAGLPSAAAATALRRHLLGESQDARGWLDIVVERAQDWLWVWTGDPSGLADLVRADLVEAGEALASGLVTDIQARLTALLYVAGQPADATGALRRQARRDALQALAEALHAEGRRNRYGEVSLFIAQLDGRFHEATRGVRLPRTMRDLDGLAWVRRCDLWRLRKHLSPVARLPRVAEALAAFEALP